MKLGIIVPCFNEEESLNHTAHALLEIFKQMCRENTIDAQSFICFVDDGSTDTTWDKIETLKTESSYIKGIKLSRNFGHQNALIAGMMQLKSQADGLITIDADLQDDTSLIPQFVAKYKEGYEVIYGVRKNRSTDTLFKRKSAAFFYKFQHFMGIESVANHADYRFLSAKALEALSQYTEIDLFLRGIIPLLGFRSTSLYYQREKRIAGESKYPLKKMIFFALDGIASFSVKPLRLITFIGFILFMLSLLGIAWVLIEKIILGNTLQGWASMMVSIYFIGGIQIMGLGIIGEYIGRSFQQGKNRPRYIVEQEI
jgi:glycosyltransferase involved in cell wall biosynthesis